MAKGWLPFGAATLLYNGHSLIKPAKSWGHFLLSWGRVSQGNPFLELIRDTPFYREEEAKGTGIDKPGRKLRRNSRSFRIEPPPKWTGKWKNLCGKNDS